MPEISTYAVSVRLGSLRMERAPVTREFPRKAPEMARNPKLQTRLSGTMPHSALSGLVVQTFLRETLNNPS